MSAKLLAVKIRRRQVSTAMFFGPHLEHVESLQLCDEPEAVTDTVARFLYRQVSAFRPHSAAIGLGSDRQGARVKSMTQLAEQLFRAEGLSLWQVNDRALLESFALPKLKSKKELREVIASFWPQLEEAELLAFEAAALGFFVQTERLFLIN